MVEQLQELLKAANQPNSLERKQIDAEIERDKRRATMHIIHAHAEQQQRWNKQNSCTHSRHETTGNAVARGTGQWTTGGQRVGNDEIVLLCQRCGVEWRWKGSLNELDYANNVGLLGYPPPPIDRCINKDNFLTGPPAPLDSDCLLDRSHHARRENQS